MKTLAKTLVLATTIGLCGSVTASPPLVGELAMDRIVAQSSQEIRLAHQRDWRRDHHSGSYPRRHHSRRNNWAAPLVAGALIGAIIASQNNSTPRRRYDNDSYSAAKRRCDREYRSYDWESDTYVTYGGTVKLCPYVRPYH